MRRRKPKPQCNTFLPIRLISEDLLKPVENALLVVAGPKPSRIEQINEVAWPSSRRCSRHDQIAPPEEIPQVELPGRAGRSPLLLQRDLASDAVVEGDHVGQVRRERGVELGGDEEQVGVRERVHVDLGEAVEEGLGQALAAAALRERVLAGEDLGARLVHAERAAELGDEDLRAVVEAGVEAFEHRLGGQVDLVQDDPVALFHLQYTCFIL